MNLKDMNIKVGQIFLDPYNPRFINQSNDDQEVILSKILQTKASIELLSSMKFNIKWVNKVVVVAKKDFSERQLKIKGIENCDFLVVEGNNRIACLKSGSIDSVDDYFEIPVLVAEKFESESSEDFQAQLRVTQGIANVMVVKEWSVISKARHLHEMYNDFKNRNGNETFTSHECYKRIADELGISTSEVRQSVIRYSFYKKICSVSDKIPEDHWGYLEAFDKTKEIRFKLGMSSETNAFLENEEDEDFIEEIYKEMPSLIRKAAHEGLNTKQFRDTMTSLLKGLNEPEAIYEFFRDITSKDSEFSFRIALDQNTVQISDKEKWIKDLGNIKRTMELLPTAAEWGNEIKPSLIAIQKLVEKQIKMIDIEI